MNALMFAATSVAWTLIALGMARHAQRVFHTLPRNNGRGFTRCGWLFLVASLAPVFAAWDEGSALVLWIAWAAFHAFALSLLIAYRPRWTPFWPTACLAVALFAASL